MQVLILKIHTEEYSGQFTRSGGNARWSNKGILVRLSVWKKCWDESGKDKHRHRYEMVGTSSILLVAVSRLPLVWEACQQLDKLASTPSKSAVSEHTPCHFPLGGHGVRKILISLQSKERGNRISKCVTRSKIRCRFCKNCVCVGGSVNVCFLGVMVKKRIKQTLP